MLKCEVLKFWGSFPCVFLFSHCNFFIIEGYFKSYLFIRVSVNMPRNFSHLLLEKCFHLLASQFLTSWGRNLEGACTTGWWELVYQKLNHFCISFKSISFSGGPQYHPKVYWLTKEHSQDSALQSWQWSIIDKGVRVSRDVWEELSTRFQSPLPVKSHRKPLITTAMSRNRHEMLSTKDVS